MTYFPFLVKRKGAVGLKKINIGSLRCQEVDGGEKVRRHVEDEHLGAVMHQME